MKKRICVEISIADKLRGFFNSEKIDIDVISGQPDNIEVRQCDDHRESNLDIIYSGGWITCEIARSLAQKMEISLEQTGKLLNLLNVKIRRCSLGCFK